MSSIYDIQGGSSLLQKLTQLDTQQLALGRVANASAFPLALAPKGGVASSSSYSLSGPDSATLINQAATASSTVLDSLQQIYSLVQTASSLTSPNYSSDATRISLQSDVQQLLAGINSAVAKAAVGGANLVASGAPTVTIQTTGLGGQFAAAVQALDTQGLGISRLDLTTDSGIQDALSRVSQALTTARTRDDTITGLSRILQGQQAFSSDVGAAISQALVTAYAGVGTYSSGAQQIFTQASQGRGGVVNIQA